jgi:glycosyltransferase involved in cell wall biosynthesis
MARKKILIVNDHLPNSGIGKYIFNVFYRAEGAGIDTDMLLARDYSGPSLDGGRIIRAKPLMGLKYKPPGFFFEAVGYFHTPRSLPKGYSLYHISSQMMGKCCEYASPAIVTCHDVIAFRVKGNHSRLSQAIQRAHLRSSIEAHRIVFNSEFSRRDFLEIFDYPPERTKVTYLGVDREVFRPREKEEAREILGLETDRPVILNVGSEDPRKNIPLLMESLGYLRNNIPDVLLVRVGRKGKETSEAIERLGLEENVRYFRNDLPEEKLSLYYNAADLLAFPSYFEGFGIPVLEAFSSGCPVVAGNGTSIPEIAEGAALLVDPHDAEEVAKGMEKCLEDRELREGLSAKGIERAGEFSWEKTAESTFRLYREVLEETAA